MTLLVNPRYRRMGIGAALIKELLHKIDDQTNNLKFLNIQSEDEELIRTLQSYGFEVLTGQYEMKYQLI
jgi:ribosomal protein S18 acetylase RimI-like enzyme